MIIEKCKKKKKAQLGFGMIMVAFIGVIVGITLFTVVAQNVGVSTSTVNVANATLLSANGTTLALDPTLSGKYVSNVVVYNSTSTGPFIVGTGLGGATSNYTIFNNQVKNGAETVIINVSSSPLNQGESWKISYTYEPTDYIGGAGRSVALLIPIFFALLIAVIALEPAMRNGVLELLGR